MIAYVDSEEQRFRTTGCGCCSQDLYLEDDRDKILEQLKKNVKVLKEACEVLGVDFLEFVCQPL